METYNLVDSSFPRDNYAVNGSISKYVIWDRNIVKMDRPTFFTDYEVFSDKVDRLNFDHRFALLIESQSIYPHMYEDFDRVASKTTPDGYQGGVCGQMKSTKTERDSIKKIKIFRFCLLGN
jgi:hypothetical protein